MFHKVSEWLMADSASQSDLKDQKQQTLITLKKQTKKNKHLYVPCTEQKNGLDMPIYIKTIVSITLISRILTKQVGFATCGSDGQHSRITLQFSFSGFVFSFLWQAHQQV